MSKSSSPPPSPDGRARGSDDAAFAGRIGAAIIAARHPDITQAELARRTGIDQPTLSKLERGMRPTPLTVWEMVKIEEACGRPPAWILGRAGITNPMHTAEITAAVNADPKLGSLSRRIILAAIDAAHDGEELQPALARS